MSLRAFRGTQGSNHTFASTCEYRGRKEEAEASLRDALERYERKRNLPKARQARERLAELQGASRPRRVGGWRI